MDYDDFTPDERSFLLSQYLDPSEFFDGRYKKRRVYKSQMEESGHSLVLTTSYCNRDHRLRTRSGHCIQCNTARISFQKRSEASGIVYVAATGEGGLSKVGVCSNMEGRLRSLRNQKYGGFDDWEIILSHFHEKAGRVEIGTKYSLFECRVMREYERSGIRQDATELYRCDPSVVCKYMQQWIARYRSCT